VHHKDGSLSVIDGISTHVPWGLAKAVTWCSTSRTFEDVYHGSKWTEDGVYMLGPAPTGLATYETNVVGDGTVEVGAQLAPSPRGTATDFTPPGPFCNGSPDMIYASLPSDRFDSPAAAIEASPDGWIAVRGRLAATIPGDVLCSTDPSQKGPVCADSAWVDGLDLPPVGDLPESVTSGLFLARVQDGSLVDLTRVPRPANSAVDER
jgi:hypothetical protein